MVTVLLLTVSLTVNAQEHHPAQGAERGSSHSEQSQDYRRFIEKPSGYDTPRGGLITQPWVWTLTAAGLVLVIGFIYKTNSDRDEKSESGVNNQTV